MKGVVKVFNKFIVLNVDYFKLQVDIPCFVKNCISHHLVVNEIEALYYLVDELVKFGKWFEVLTKLQCRDVEFVKKELQKWLLNICYDLMMVRRRTKKRIEKCAEDLSKCFTIELNLSNG